MFVRILLQDIISGDQTSSITVWLALLGSQLDFDDLAATAVAHCCCFPTARVSPAQDYRDNREREREGGREEQ